MNTFPQTCPVCHLPIVPTEQGLLKHIRNKAKNRWGQNAHGLWLQTYKETQKLKTDQSLMESIDFVICSICGKKMRSLSSHIRTHGLNIQEYRNRFGDVPVDSKKVIEAKHLSLASVLSTRTNMTRSTVRPKELKPRPRLPAPPPRDLSKLGGSEPDDYVTCRVCGSQMFALGSHIARWHPEFRETYRTQFPESFTQARRLKLGSPKGSVFTDEAKRKSSDKQRIKIEPEVIQQFKLEDGSIDHRRLASHTKLSAKIVKRSILESGLAPTDCYLNHLSPLRVVLTQQDFDPYRLKNGKVAIIKASLGLGYNHRTLQKECIRLGISIAHKMVAQELCLEVISRVLGGSPFTLEWNPPGCLNPETGGKLRFDGYFREYHLLVEYQGFQHSVFPNIYHGENREKFDEMQRRDRLKVDFVSASEMYKLMVINEVDPWEDTKYIQKKLQETGIL